MREWARFLDALRDVARRERSRVFFVLGVDLAHVGQALRGPRMPPGPTSGV